MKLVLSEIFPPRHGGSGRWMFELYRRFPEQSIKIITHKNASETEQSIDENYPQSVYRYQFANSEWGIRSVSGLKFYLKNLVSIRKHLKDIEQIHCSRCLHEGVLGLLLAKLYRKKLVVYVHGEDIETAKTSRELAFLAQKVINGADVIITNSNNSKNLLESQWDTSKTNIVTIHPGVDISQFKPAPGNDQVLQNLGWTDRYVVLTVGRLQRRKGQDKMIEALQQLQESIPNILYVIAGSGEDLSYLKERANHFDVADHVQFIADASDETLIQMYQQCDLFILPNRTEGTDIEGFGMVLVEAQACGKPVIAGNSGGTAEALQIGTTGERVDCTDTAKIAQAITTIKNSPELYSQENCLQFVHNNLSWEKHLEKATLLFEGIKS
jgi:phosphatidylinositol alpha-1,6-mannosyltransferase